jgi:hypothetical protein
MKFTVDRSQAEVKPFASPGEYIVTVNSCKDDNLDKNGNPVCTLRYKGGNGEVISDRFVLKDTPSAVRSSDSFRGSLDSSWWSSSKRRSTLTSTEPNRLHSA